MSESLPRVLHVTVALGYGGMEMMLARLIEADRGLREHWVVALMDDASPDPDDSYSNRLQGLGAKVHALGFARGRFSLTGFFKLVRIFRDCRPAILSGWNYPSNLAVLSLSLLSGFRVRAVCNIRCSVQLPADPGPFQRLFFFMHACAARLADIVIFNSRRAAAAHIRLGYPAAHSLVIANGFDPSQFRPDAGLRASLRRQLGIGEKQILVGLIGRLHPDKDHGTFLAAAGIAAKAQPELMFLVAGAGTEKILSDLAPLIADIGPDRMRVLGHRADMTALYNALDICALSSIAEGFPNVLGEAMACGVPCAATDVGDVATLLGETGAICPPRDAPGLARALLAIAAADRAALGRAARQRILENFSLQRAHHDFSRIWESGSVREISVQPLPSAAS